MPASGLGILNPLFSSFQRPPSHIHLPPAPVHHYGRPGHQRHLADEEANPQGGQVARGVPALRLEASSKACC